MGIVTVAGVCSTTLVRATLCAPYPRPLRRHSGALCVSLRLLLTLTGAPAICSSQRQLTEYGFRTVTDKVLDPAAAAVCSTWYSAPELSAGMSYEEFRDMCERRRRLNNLKKAADQQRS